jgi:glycosyltransferase involved in cell wall biosynthesis
MRILYFTRDYTTHDHRFVTTLAKTRHQIYYLRLERGQIQLEDRPLPPDVELIAWNGGQRKVNLYDGPRLLAGLKKVIQKVKPDLIQAGPIQRSAFLAALTGFHPLVSTSWGYDLIQDAQRNAAWWWATRYTLRHSDVMVGDCNTIRQLACSFGMPDKRIITFPWGIDLEHFSPADRSSATTGQTEDKPFSILSTRNWEEIYGVEVIAHAFCMAQQKRPNLRLVMLGNGSQAGLLRKILRCETGDYVNQQVSFPGQVGYNELPRYYRQADLYVAATHSDGTSISLLEALACGCPVLVSDIPGNREWVTAGKQGWLFPDGDSEALAKAIVEAYDQRNQLRQMGQVTRKLAEERADWKRNFQELLKAYEMAKSIACCE